MSIIDISEVKPGSHVTLHYRLALADGADIVNTFTDKPATLLLGAGQLAPPLEDILLGLKVGHHSTFRLTPEQAFGPRNPELIQRVSLTTLREHSMIGEDFSPGDLVEFERRAAAGLRACCRKSARRRRCSTSTIRSPARRWRSK